MRTRRLALCLILSLLLVSVAAAPARAKSRDTLQADYDLVWSTLVRLVRVDYDMKIIEKDKDVGYLLFSYRDSGKVESRASIELKAETRKDKDPASCSILVSIPGGRGGEERVLIADLKRKLKE